MDEQLPRRLAIATLPLFIWALHFFACYFLAAAQCSPARSLLALLTALALLACLACLWRCRIYSKRAPSGLFDWAQLGSALLGTIGVALTSIPLLLVTACGG